MTLYVLLKYLHVVLAIIAIGFNASYAVWLSRAGREPEHALWALRGIKILIGGIPLTSFWTAAALVLYVILLVGAAGFYSPTLRRQIAILESLGPTSAEYQSLSRRGTTVGIVLAVLVLIIEFLMVTKPTL
jgi:uncharacterized membrane protein